jgi:hypothetical protein
VVTPDRRVVRGQRLKEKSRRRLVELKHDRAVVEVGTLVTHGRPWLVLLEFRKRVRAIQPPERLGCADSACRPR